MEYLADKMARYDSLYKQLVVPDWMKNDRHEPVTQEEFVAGIKQSVREIGLTESEIQEIIDGKCPKGQLRTYIPYSGARD